MVMGGKEGAGIREHTSLEQLFTADIKVRPFVSVGVPE